MTFDPTTWPFEVVALVTDSPERQATASSFAWNGERLVRGTYRGGLEIHAGASLADRTTHDELFTDAVAGTQWLGEQVLCLGTERRISHEGDWGHELRLVDVTGARASVHRTSALGPGNWHLVQGHSGSRALVRDRTQRRGLVAHDATTGSVVWRALGGDRLGRVLPTDDGSLLVFTGDRDRELVEIDRDAGHVRRRVVLPDTPEWCWTTALMADGDELILGGFERESRRIRITRWTTGDHCVRAIHEGEIADHFGRATIEYVESCEEDYGNDLHEIAELRWLERGRSLLVILGGGDDASVACQGATAVGVLDLDCPSTFATHVLDDERGCMGTVVDPATGLFFIEAGAGVYVLRLRPR